MIEELINGIIIAEEDAEKNIHEGIIKAKEIVSVAIEKAGEIEKAAYTEVKELVAKNLEAAEVSATKICDDLINNSKILAEEVKKKAMKNIDKAVDIIVRRIVCKYADI